MGMAGFGKVFFAAMVSVVVAEGDNNTKAALRGTSNAASAHLSNTTNNTSLEEMELLPTNFAVSNHGCNIKCVYSDWARGTCHGTTRVCSGLKSSQPLSLPNTCQVPGVSQGDDSCNIVCVY